MPLARGRPGAVLPARNLAWRPIVSPETDLALAVGLPAGASAAIAVWVGWVLLTPLAHFELDYPLLLLTAGALPVLHEGIHALAMPHARALTLECDLRRLVLRVGHKGTLSRTRYVAVLLAPFVALSLLPVAGAACFATAPAPLVVISLGNALVCGADLLAAGLALAQVPGNALVRAPGEHASWQLRERP